MKRYLFYPILFLMTFLNHCKNDEGSFVNAMYFDSIPNEVTQMLVKDFPSFYNQTESVRAAIPKPIDQKVTFRYKVDYSLVDYFNHTYGETALALPADHYQLKPNAEIASGGVRSGETMVNFVNLNKLDLKRTYVLPVTITDANIPVLGSARTHYFVIKKGALINKVTNIQGNYLQVKWNKPAVCNNLSKFTMEALVRAQSFDGDAGINALMGDESTFMIRIGDGGFPKNQIQVYHHTDKGDIKFPPKDESKGLYLNKWTHIAITYNGSDNTIIIYVDGELQSEGTLAAGNTVDLTSDKGFYIGHEWNLARDFKGEVAELRIWNVIRTPEEIAANPYYVDPHTPGLVAYWKCDEGTGNTVKDATGNGNDATAKQGTPLKWESVQLPPAEE